jgi:hypothetical protein
MKSGRGRLKKVFLQFSSNNLLAWLTEALMSDLVQLRSGNSMYDFTIIFLPAYKGI